MWKHACLLPLLLIAALPALAEDDPPRDCTNPQTQSDMTVCSSHAAKAADKALNAQYRKTRAAMVAFDQRLEPDLAGAEKALVAAQRAWIIFRDNECALAGYQAAGGSMQSMLVADCLAEVTRARTSQLKEDADLSP